MKTTFVEAAKASVEVAATAGVAAAMKALEKSVEDASVLLLDVLRRRFEAEAEAYQGESESLKLLSMMFLFHYEETLGGRDALDAHFRSEFEVKGVEEMCADVLQAFNAV